MCKRAYVVAYTTKSGDRIQGILQTMKTFGKTQEILMSSRGFVFLLIAESDSKDSTAIKHELEVLARPFEDSICVARIDVLDSAGDSAFMAMLSNSKGDNAEVRRNFERFSSKSEARAIYENEKPRWVYSDGIGMAMPVDFDREWPWLPIKENGIYDKRENAKYL